jgi:AraC-like DNA-binding protein
MDTLLILGDDGYQNELKISAQIHVILSELLSQVTTTYDIHSGVITKAIRYIEDHFVEDISVKEVADSVYFSEYYFSRLFRTYTNMSPFSYIVKLRIILAEHLLVNGTDSVENVGTKCGFNSVQHFIRSFRKHMGCTPYQYRKRNQEIISY